MNAVPSKSVIEEAAVELGIDPAFVEKDWYVVQLIRGITAAELFGANVIFTGGTALSKAHRLLQRFSEDIDFRLILPSEPPLTRSRQRKLLSSIRARLQELIAAQFPTAVIQWKSRDENRFFSFELDYPSIMSLSVALRPHVLIEFTVATLSLPPIFRPVFSFITELTKTAAEIPTVACIDPVENAVDKMSALVWRVPDRVRQPADDDPDLVRHIHDLAVLQPQVTGHKDFKRLTVEMIQQDDNRCNKITGWPVKEKLHLLVELLTSDTEYPKEYTRFVQGMSYAAGGVPTYAEAMAKLRTLVDHLL